MIHGIAMPLISLERIAPAVVTVRSLRPAHVIRADISVPYPGHSQDSARCLLEYLAAKPLKLATQNDSLAIVSLALYGIWL